ncbi:MAG: DUF5050 domain-containing protein [Fimbriimonadales bacterium]
MKLNEMFTVDAGSSAPVRSGKQSKNFRGRSVVLAGVATLMVSGVMVGFTRESPGKPIGAGMKPTPLVLGPMIFVSNRSGIISGTPNGNEIWTMNANGTTPVRLTNNTTAEWEPHWNPDGTKIAFTSNLAVNWIPWDGNWDVYTMDPDGSNVTNLTDSPSYDFGSTWSPDGSKIAFATDRDGNLEIYVMNSDGSNPVNLTNNGASDGHSAWSPDGSKIAFSSNRDGNDEIYVMNADGSGVVTRITTNYAIDISPTWSPDGTKIAFSSSRSGAYDIYSMNANGSGLKRLTNNPAEEYEPNWSPDGTMIVYYRRHDGTSNNLEIYTMKADGKQQVRLTNNYPFLDGDPTWKPLP